MSKSAPNLVKLAATTKRVEWPPKSQMLKNALGPKKLKRQKKQQMCCCSSTVL